MEFKVLWTDDLDTFHTLSKQIVQEMPNVCFLDYSSHPEKMMTVARTLPRLFDRGANIIGLWDRHALKTHILESKTLGIPFTHYKSPEYGDLVSQAAFLLKEGPFPEGEFAKAEVMKKPVVTEARSLFRIGYVTDKYAHVEHDFLPPEGKDLLLYHTLGETFPIDRFRLERRLDNNYYYEMAYVSDLSYVFLDPEEVKEEEPIKNTKTQKKKAFWQDLSKQESIEAKRKKVNQYIEEKGTKEDSSKRTRLMVIDDNMTIVQQAKKPLDSYPYSIRFFRSIHNRKDLIRRIKPGIICYQCPPKQEGELGDIMEKIEGMENFNPFVVVFQSAWSSEHLQKHFNYSRIISWNEIFNFQQLLDFCETYEKKAGREKSHDQRMSYHNKEKRVYLSKSDPASYLEFPFKVELKAVCETWIKFQTEEDLSLWSILSVELPVPFDFTIIEKIDEKDWAKKGFNQYRGVVHGLGERERAQMRVAVNKMIFEEAHFEEEESDKKKN